MYTEKQRNHKNAQQGAISGKAAQGIDHPEPPEVKLPKDKWDVIKVLARPISATLTALAIAALGYYGQKTVTNISAQNQQRLTTISAQEQNARLYTELLSRREQSESLLRKDMFSVILEDFLKDFLKEETTTKEASSNLSQKLLKLELLSLNFGDSLSLSPLFLEIKRDIENSTPSEKEKLTWNIKKKKHEKRLHSLAKRVASSQIAAIKLRGFSQVIEVPVGRVLFCEDGTEKTYLWPDDQFNQLDGYDEEMIQELMDSQQQLTLEGVTWVFKLEFSNAFFNQKTVDVYLKIFEQTQNGQLSQFPLEKNFKLDYFNFPLIDNTRLPNNQRFALIMTDFFEDKIKVEGILFPAVYSSQRDKPYLNEVLDELRGQHPERNDNDK